MCTVCVLSGQGKGKITFHMTGFVPPIEYSTRDILYSLVLLFICDAHAQRGLKVLRLLQRNKYQYNINSMFLLTILSGEICLKYMTEFGKID